MKHFCCSLMNLFHHKGSLRTHNTGQSNQLSVRCKNITFAVADRVYCDGMSLSTVVRAWYIFCLILCLVSFLLEFLCKALLTWPQTLQPIFDCSPVNIVAFSSCMNSWQRKLLLFADLPWNLLRLISVTEKGSGKYGIFMLRWNSDNGVMHILLRCDEETTRQPTIADDAIFKNGTKN